MDIAIIVLLCITIVIGVLNLLRRSTATIQDEDKSILTEKIEVENRFTRENITTSLKIANEGIVTGVKNTNEMVIQNIQTLTQTNQQQIAQMRDNLDKGLQEIRNNVHQNLKEVREDNSKQLAEMRKIVEEKLSSTINERLSQSFNTINEQLKQVYEGLGEMKELAGNVTDLRKVLTNVKTRGIWGELSLENLLDSILSPAQYIKGCNVAGKGSGQVDFAIILPGKNDDKVFLPIDAKFPTEDYQRMIKASETNDLESYAKHVKEFETTIKNQAKSISRKYIIPPRTTDFAIMYLPTEGLYAEINRIPGLIEELQNKYKIIPSGPSNTTALLNSLNLGFKTLAIQKSTHDIFKVFVAFKKDFGKFVDNLEQAKQHIGKASDTLDDATKRTDYIQKRLKKVENLSYLEGGEGA